MGVENKSFLSLGQSRTGGGKATAWSTFEGQPSGTRPFREMLTRSTPLAWLHLVLLLSTGTTRDLCKTSARLGGAAPYNPRPLGASPGAAAHGWAHLRGKTAQTKKDPKKERKKDPKKERKKERK